MAIDRDKIDEVTLALLNLVMWEEDEYGARVWKGFDWATMSRLHEKGYIQNPRGKARSVIMLPEGVKRSKELFEKYFVRPGDNEKS